MELNGFYIQLSAENFTGYEFPYVDHQSYKILKQELKADWFLYKQADKVIALQITEKATPLPNWQPVELLVNEHNKLLAARISNVLPELFRADRQIEIVKYKPFVFFGKKDELLAKASTRLKSKKDILNKLKIWKKFEIDVRLVEPSNNQSGIGLFISVGLRCEISATIQELTDAGINLQGLYVVGKRTEEDDRNKLLGKIDHVSGDYVYLSEYFEGGKSNLNHSEVYLESSKDNFSSILRQLVGSDYLNLQKALLEEEGKTLSGPNIDTIIVQTARYIGTRSPIKLSKGLSFSLKERISISNTSDYQSIILAPVVNYCFDSSKAKKSPYAWQGLKNFGPFSRDTFPKKSPKIMVVFPDNAQSSVERFIKLLIDGTGERYRYFSGGLLRIFSLINPEFPFCAIPLMDGNNANAAQRYKDGISKYLSQQDDIYPDAAIVVIPDEFAELPVPQNPFLVSKAHLLTHGIPVQQVKLSKVKKDEESLQYILQTLSVALYAKLRGVPWTIDSDAMLHEELVIGIGTCVQSGNRFDKKDKFVGITTVFRGDGSYLLGNISKECTFDDYPEMLRTTTLGILRDIKVRNGWQPGDTIRLIFHAYNPVRKEDIAKIIDSCAKELGEDHNIEYAFLTISEEHPFIAFNKAQLGPKGTFAPDRGTIIQIGKYTRLLCLNGPSLIKRANAALPSPMLISLHPDSTFRDLPYLTEQCLKFTSLSWKSLLPASKPVTIYYSELIARFLSKFRMIPGWSPSMLDTKLQVSRWFL